MIVFKGTILLYCLFVEFAISDKIDVFIKNLPYAKLDVFVPNEAKLSEMHQKIFRIYATRFSKVQLYNAKTMISFQNPCLIIWDSKASNKTRLFIQNNNIGLLNPCWILNYSQYDTYELPLNIGQEIYFLLAGSNRIDILETYSINNINIVRNLTFVRTMSSIQNLSNTLLRRRSNFYGIKLKVIVGEQAPFNIVEEKISLPGDETYLHIPDPKGLFVDILSYLKSRLNFSTEHYTRIDGIWGNTLPNGVSKF